jgi:hypothetical protein
MPGVPDFDQYFEQILSVETFDLDTLARNRTFWV